MVLGVRILQPPLNINGYENWYIGLVAIWCADWVKSSSRVLNCAGSNPVPFTNFNIIDIRNFLVLFIFAVLLSSCVDKTIDCTVYSVEKIQETSGDSERGVHTETYWLVSTDKGTYSIQPSGVGISTSSRTPFWREVQNGRQRSIYFSRNIGNI